MLRANDKVLDGLKASIVLLFVGLFIFYLSRFYRVFRNLKALNVFLWSAFIAT